MSLTFKSELRGSVELPASKSLSNRALLINSLAKPSCQLEGLAQCDDTKAMRLAVNAALGKKALAKGIRKAKKVVTGMGDLFAEAITAPPTEPAITENPPIAINVGAAGTAMRFATALLAVTEGKRFNLSGSERMHHRPISILVEALRALGADIEYAGKEGYPPLEISGKRLTGTTVELSAEVSSQYISALLMLGPVLPNGLQLRLRGDIISRPYINLTLSVMEAFGAKAVWIGESTIYVHADGYQRESPFHIEKDWSAASYWYELVALSDDPDACIDLPGLDTRSMQGDRRVMDYFARLGVRTEQQENGVRLTKTGVEPDIFLSLDLSEQPDIAQTLVVTCAMLGVPFHFTGLQTLRIKETDRLAALQNELEKFGVIPQVRLDNELLWDGSSKRHMPASIDTYDDHRMAMAFAPCALKHPGLTINNPDVVTKSYPNFWNDLCPFLNEG